MQAYSAPLHTASVNGVAFAPHELGLMLATASSDGSMSVLSYRQADGAWSAVQVFARFRLVLHISPILQQML
jgi:protein transport protein SEC13